MTCIVGIVSGSDVWIGGDSAGSNNSYISARRDPKVFRVGEMLMGVCGSFRLCQLLRCSFTPPEHPADMDTERYLVGPFCDAMRKVFKDAGAITVNNNKEDGTSLLLGYRGGLYGIESDYQIGQFYDGYDATGSGMYYALGSLHSTCDTEFTFWPPQNRIEKALDAASHFCPSVRGPYIIEKL